MQFMALFTRHPDKADTPADLREAEFGPSDLRVFCWKGAAVAAYIDLITEGVILGSQGFFESHFLRLKQKLGYRRHKAATHLTALGSPGL
jgi:hypothetical protein